MSSTTTTLPHHARTVPCARRDDKENDGWVCSMCTFVNDNPEFLSCDLCGTKRGQATITVAQAPAIDHADVDQSVLEERFQEIVEDQRKLLADFESERPSLSRNESLQRLQHTPHSISRLSQMVAMEPAEPELVNPPKPATVTIRARRVTVPCQPNRTIENRNGGAGMGTDALAAALRGAYPARAQNHTQTVYPLRTQHQTHTANPPRAHNQTHTTRCGWPNGDDSRRAQKHAPKRRSTTNPWATTLESVVHRQEGLWQRVEKRNTFTRTGSL